VDKIKFLVVVCPKNLLVKMNRKAMAGALIAAFCCLAKAKNKHVFQFC
jgi:hypothetical protein